MRYLKGKPKPFGPTMVVNGMNFSLFSKNAEKVILHIEKDGTEFEVKLDPSNNKTGDVWHILIEGLSPPFTYAYQLDGPRKQPHYFHPDYKLIDPYSKRLDTSSHWGSCRNEKYRPRGAFLSPVTFDWQGVQSPKIDLSDLIIYEMHVRGFTEHPSSQVKNPGKFLGLIEKIPYLVDLGINAVELMPIQEFNECGYSRLNPSTKKPLCNFWGYSTINYFSVMNRYVSDYKNSIEEFKTLVRELHRNGIEIILDIVLNHTGEKGKEEGLYSFMGIDHSVYYLLDNGHHVNYTGCGHTVNLNHPIVRQFVREVLHYWVIEMHVDGFRFDLATTMNRDKRGNLLEESPLIEELSHDPILSQVKLIAEPWDIGGYQLGSFHPQEEKWSEINGRYRDTVRSFIKGDYHSKNDFAARITGSQDIFPQRDPSASINFITLHDGFTLRDLVTYNEKHNELNGEKNNDGNDQNLSWNMGVEGKTEDPTIQSLRLRQMKNFIFVLMISRGIPLIYMGDEYGHTKEGNNNTWCQDNELSWFLWDVKTPFTDFVKKMIQFRKDNPIFRSKDFYAEGDIVWHGLHPGEPGWDSPYSYLAYTIQNDFYIAFNASSSPLTFEIPENGGNWVEIINTSSEESFSNIPLESKLYELDGYSSLLLRAH